jgi:serine/threonine protein phosphatase PrpC
MTVLYEVQVRTDRGNVRERNEDAVGTVLDWRHPLHLDDPLLDERGHLFAVADGMGGHAAGEIASHLAVATLFRAYYAERRKPPAAALTAAIAAAHEAVCQQAAAHRGQADMGTTLLAALWLGADLWIANVGDSRAYLFHEGCLQQVTRDHSWVAEQVAAGLLSPAEAAHHPYRNIITRSLGPQRNAEPDLFHLTTQPGDRLLLCSDGLSNLLSAEEMAAFLATYPLDQAATQMLERALERGAPDNVTLVLVQFHRIKNRVNRRRQRILAAMLVILLLGLALYQVRRPRPIPATPTPAVLLSLGRLEAPPLSPAPMPSLALPPADPVWIAAIAVPPEAMAAGDRPLGRPQEADTVIVGRPLPDRYVVFVYGVITSLQTSNEGWHLAMARRDREGRPYRYLLTLRGPWPTEATPLAVGSALAVIGRPVEEADREGDIALEPLVILTEEGGQESLQTQWVNPTAPSWPQEYKTQWVFTTYGAGGAAVLGIPTPTGLDGLPIALWGGWESLPSHPAKVVFRIADRTPYEWSGKLYRQPDH